MGECQFCNQEMNEASSCTKNAIAEPDGRWFYAVTYGEEEGDLLEAIERCPDCGVEPGGTHHPGCDWERHPVSGHQLLNTVLSRPAGERPLHARLEADPHAGITMDDVYENQHDRQPETNPTTANQNEDS